MTLQELERLKDILVWARTKALTGGMFDTIVGMEKIVDRDIKMKTMDVLTKEGL